MFGDTIGMLNLIFGVSWVVKSTWERDFKEVFFGTRRTSSKVRPCSSRIFIFLTQTKTSKGGTKRDHCIRRKIGEQGILSHMDYEKEEELLKSGDIVIGADEVGRGALAGPIVGCGCLINLDFISAWKRENEKILIRDSKKMTKIQREKSAQWLAENIPFYAIVERSADEIDAIGIQKSNGEVLQNSVEQILEKFHLSPQNGNSSQKIHILIDHFPIPSVNNRKALSLQKGESKSIAIAAASIIAKVHRDRLMDTYSVNSPEYMWGANKGYGTAQHREAIIKYGLSKKHRKSFTTKII